MIILAIKKLIRPFISVSVPNVLLEFLFLIYSLTMSSNLGCLIKSLKSIPFGTGDTGCDINGDIGGGTGDSGDTCLVGVKLVCSISNLSLAISSWVSLICCDPSINASDIVAYPSLLITNNLNKEIN
jgi:hypothetical protein